MSQLTLFVSHKRNARRKAFLLHRCTTYTARQFNEKLVVRQAAELTNRLFVIGSNGLKGSLQQVCIAQIESDL